MESVLMIKDSTVMKVLTIIAKNLGIGRKRLSELLELSSPTLVYHLKRLEEHGYIESHKGNASRRGPKKLVYRSISKKCKCPKCEKYFFVPYCTEKSEVLMCLNCGTECYVTRVMPTYVIMKILEEE